MSVDAVLGLQKAIVAALEGYAPLTALVPAARIFDDVPQSATKPYVSLGFVQALTEEAEGYDGLDIYQQIDAWSEAIGIVEAKQIGAAIRAALHLQPLAIEGNRLVRLTVDDVRYLREPDGKTKHAAITLRARTEPA